MTLIDTSSWVHFLRRKGDVRVKQRVTRLLVAGESAICELVAVELWMGVGSVEDSTDLQELVELVPCLEINAESWMLARKLAQKCREAGRLVPSSDLVIAACAFCHGAEIDSEDAHFALLERFRAN